MYLMGIDIGTTATKIILIDLFGRVVASAEQPSTLLSQRAGWAEEDPNEWWQNVCRGIPAEARQRVILRVSKRPAWVARYTSRRKIVSPQMRAIIAPMNSAAASHLRSLLKIPSTKSVTMTRHTRSAAPVQKLIAQLAR